MNDDFTGGQDDTDNSGDNQSGSALRKFGNEQKKRADDLAKELAEIRAELAKRQAADVFTELGINEKVRKFYSGEPTKDAITEWWKENAEVFGVDPAAGDVTQTPEQQQAAAQLQQVSELNQFGQEKPTAFSRDSLAQMRQGLLSNRKATDADFADILQKMGVPDLPLQAPQF